MVSSKVHTQLMQMADEKAMLAERRAQELEREVCVCVCVHEHRSAVKPLNKGHFGSKISIEFVLFWRFLMYCRCSICAS